jgi:hypothetical protein
MAKTTDKQMGKALRRLDVLTLKVDHLIQLQTALLSALTVPAAAPSVPDEERSQDEAGDAEGSTVTDLDGNVVRLGGVTPSHRERGLDG